MVKKDKYKDPVNKAILDEISKKVKNAKKELGSESFSKHVIDCYKIGLYGGANVVLRNLGKEPL